MRAGWLLSAAIAVPCLRWHAADLGAFVVIVISGITAMVLIRRNTQLLASMRTDYRTGLLTIQAWREAATAELSRAERRDTPLAVAIIDIDHFKTVNDTFAHLAGDEFLVAVAGTLLAQLRCYDRTGRYGGDEFVVLFPGTTAEQAARIATRLCGEISSAPILAGLRHDTAVFVTVSIGSSELVGVASSLDVPAVPCQVVPAGLRTSRLIRSPGPSVVRGSGGRGWPSRCTDTRMASAGQVMSPSLRPAAGELLVMVSSVTW